MHFAVVCAAAFALATTATVLIPPPTPGLNCALCLDDLDSLTGCGGRPDKPHHDPDCLCSPENSKLAKGCNNACKGVRSAKDMTCIWGNEIAKQEHTVTARGPYGCAVCLQDAERKMGCADDPSDPKFDFDCLCQEPGFSTNVEDCNLFCADIPLNLDNQCPKPSPSPFTERELADNDPPSCGLCLELASRQTYCQPDADGFDFDCLCKAKNSEWVSGCTSFCVGTPNDLNTHCSAPYPYPSPSPALPATTIITARGTIGNPKQTVDPRFGFCGPKGTNCKSTVRAPPTAEKWYHLGYGLGSNVLDNNPYGPPRPTITLLPKGSVPHHGNPSTMQIASGRFGFCGPSGINCRIGDAEHSSSSALAQPMVMVRDNLTTIIPLNASFTTTLQAIPGPSDVVNVTSFVTTTAGDANPTVTHTHIQWDAQDSMQNPTPTAGVQQGSAGVNVGKNVAEIFFGIVAIAAFV